MQFFIKIKKEVKTMTNKSNVQFVRKVRTPKPKTTTHKKNKNKKIEISKKLDNNIKNQKKLFTDFKKGKYTSEEYRVKKNALEKQAYNLYVQHCNLNNLPAPYFKPDIEGNYVWEWDDVKEDWWDDKTSMYYQEIVDANGGRLEYYPVMDYWKRY